MFRKKNNCRKCNSKVNDDFDFCPYCGLDLRDPEKDMRDFGMLGKNNEVAGYPLVGGMGGLGISERMINNIMKNLFRAFDNQMRELDANMQTTPGRIKIKFGTVPRESKKKKGDPTAITKEQIDRMSGLPRVEGKADVRRLSDRVVYEIKAPGVDSVNDVFFSKLESGYEVKAIGKKKVYVNSLPVNLPLRGYALRDNKLVVEFELQ